MHSLDRNVTITPVEFKSPVADCYDMYFTGVGGARVYAKLLKPKNIQGKCPAVIHFHGYNGCSLSWTDYIKYAASGFVVASMDTRGQSGKSEDVGGHMGNTMIGQIVKGLENEPKKLFFRDVFLDTAELANIIMDMPEVDETRVGAWGGSQGGALTLVCASLEPRINRAAPQYPFLCDYKRVWDMDLDANEYRELRAFFRIRDPLHEREEEIFTKLGYIDLQHLAPRIKGKLKLFIGLMDNICPPSTQFSAYNKMTCEKELVVYPDYGHEPLKYCEDMIYTYMLEML